MADLHPNTRRALTKRLLDWYARFGRDLPWRHTTDPYAIWLSEIMLQQTRVETVTEYYRRFLHRLPTVAALASARIDTVLKLWEGLGYYGRARRLHQAAKIIVRDHAGRLPRSAEGLRRLPGVGRYTAGAIASIAFGRDEPVLDGNVARVLSRLAALEEPPDRHATQQRLWDLARSLLPPGRAGAFNQALMDLGATVCTPQKPRCKACPVRTLCRARRAGLQDDLPRRSRPPALPHQTVVVGLVRRGRGRHERLLIARRKPEGLLGGLWELPGGKVQPGESLPAALRRELREEVALTVHLGPQRCTVRHAYSHFRITMHVFDCRVRTGRARALAADAVRWVRPQDLHRFAFPRATHKAFETLGLGPA